MDEPATMAGDLKGSSLETTDFAASRPGLAAVPAGAPRDGSRLRALVLDHLRTAEEAELKSEPAVGHPRTAAERDAQARPLRIEWRTVLSRPRMLFFNAVRSYPGENPGCDAVTHDAGWIAAGRGGAMRLLSAHAVLTDCDAMDLRTLTPLAVLRSGAKTYVVSVEHGYEDEVFVISEIGTASVEERLRVEGGGC